MVVKTELTPKVKSPFKKLSVLWLNKASCCILVLNKRNDYNEQIFEHKFEHLLHNDAALIFKSINLDGEKVRENKLLNK
jgi:hypothetical protein